MADIYKSESETKLLRYFITLFSSLSAIVFIVYGSSYILDGNVIFGIFELIPGIILIINLYFLWIKNTIDRSAMVVVFFVMLVSIGVFINGGIENTGNLWVILVPMFPLLLLNFKDGLKWLLTYSAVIFTITILGMLEILSLKFTFLELRQTMIVYTLFIILIYYNEKVKYINRQSLIAHSKELREKDSLLLEQSKLAQMGDMLNMIAHQWRQPLNAMSASAIQLSMKNDLDMIDKDSIENTSKFIQKQTQLMSQIINDFMDFNKSQKNSEFLLFEAVEQVIKMILPQLKNRNITLKTDIDKDIKVFHNSKNIEHVLLNIIMNARDAFEENNHIENKTIKIFTTSDKDYVTLTIEDNAGGIPKNIINKIFNPYFTTKEQGKGTGIGLYMSKKMVESIDDNTLSVEVIEGTTLFKIKLKL